MLCRDAALCAAFRLVLSRESVFGVLLPRLQSMVKSFLVVGPVFAVEVRFLLHWVRAVRELDVIPQAELLP